VFFVLAAIGTVTVVFALCLLVGGYLLLESLARTVAAAAGTYLLPPVSAQPLFLACAKPPPMVFF